MLQPITIRGHNLEHSRSDHSQCISFEMWWTAFLTLSLVLTLANIPITVTAFSGEEKGKSDIYQSSWKRRGWRWRGVCGCCGVGSVGSNHIFVMHLCVCVCVLFILPFREYQQISFVSSYSGQTSLFSHVWVVCYVQSWSHSLYSDGSSCARLAWRCQADQALPLNYQCWIHLPHLEQMWKRCELCIMLRTNMYSQMGVM